MGVLTTRFLRKGGSYIQGLLTYIQTILRGPAFMGVTFRFLMLRCLKFWRLIFRRYYNVFETNEREMETRLKIEPQVKYWSLPPCDLSFFYFQGVRRDMENSEQDFQSAVESYQELSNTGKYMLFIQDGVVDDKCDSLKKKWESLANSIPERVETLMGELNSWRSFHEKLDAFLAWVDEMETFTKIEKPRDESEALQQLKGLEVSCSVM